MKTILNRIAENKTGFWLALAAVLFVGGWRVFAIVHQPAHWREAVAELAAPQLRDTFMVNDSNSGLVYAQDGEYGRNSAFYFYDIAAGKKTRLYELPAKGGDVSLYGWSPDDSFFIYSHPVGNYLNREFFICDGKSGKPLADLVASDNVSHFAWLSPHSFAYIASQHLIEVERDQDGKWTQSHIFNNVGQGLEYFTALSANSVAWQASRKIVEFDLSSGVSKIIWESPTNQLVNFFYSKAGEFVLECRDTNTQGYCSMRFNNPANWKTEARIAAMPQKETTEDIMAKDSSESALLTKEDFNAFYIKTNANSGSVRMPWLGGVAKYVLNHGQLYISGSLMNESGVWRYDIASKSLDQLVSTIGQPFKYAKDVPATTGVTANVNGDQRGYFLWQPDQISSGRKYPLILCETVPERIPQPLAAANAGCYFALVGHSTENHDIEKRPIINIYEALATNPNIDTSRVFLWGRDDETGYISQLLANNPDNNPNLWKGVILFNPRSMPDLESLRGKQIFISTGKEAGNVKNLIKYQDKAFAAGIPMTLILLDNVGGDFAKLGAARESAMQFTKFLLQN